MLFIMPDSDAQDGIFASFDEIACVTKIKQKTFSAN